jgi:hypothetical protein
MIRPKLGYEFLILPVGIVLACASLLAVSAQQPSQSSELTCIVDLDIPAYSKITWEAGRSGKMRVSIDVDKDGTPSVMVDGADIAIAFLLRDQFLRSKFNPQCQGRLLNYTVEFRLEGQPSTILLSSTRFRPPDLFIVTARPALPSVNP